MKRKKNTRDYHKMPRFENGGEVNFMTQEERRERGTNVLRERMTRRPDTDELIYLDKRTRDDGPTAKELQRRENDSERATLRQLRERVKKMDKEATKEWDESEPINSHKFKGWNI